MCPQLRHAPPLLALVQRENRRDDPENLTAKRIAMALRFRKRIKLFSGLRINLSKSGVSASIGTPGATINLKSGRKSRATLGIPGTGLSDSFNIADRASHQQEGDAGSSIFGLFILAAFVLAIFAVAYFFGVVFVR